ncbi:hypothetical protein UFOVP1604_142 [uncultured Caudovirales phage]|uniref:Cysteinyl-tRNA ligase anticodon binding domain-containing protein n=1 Tax=uncultured Caudovirales phage TaxID=2100421 RepID=A0A6J5SUU1_9CAUD|nr:hypothetical protein UFOVP1604_142 [uncultured Caudovirales phage]
MNLEELIESRRLARAGKDWKTSDEIRNTLDSFGIFVFDTKDGQEVHYLPTSYFKFKTKEENSTKAKTWSEWLRDPSRHTMTDRLYVETLIKRDIAAVSNFEAWLYSIKQQIQKDEKRRRKPV